MNANDKKVLENLVKSYVAVYPIKDSFKKDYFNYPIEKINEVINNLFEEIQSKATAKKSKPKSKFKVLEVEKMSTKEEAKDYYLNNMIYDRTSSEAKKKLIDFYLKEDLKKIYSLLNEKKASNNLNKTDLLNQIDLYFDNIDRAKKF